MATDRHSDACNAEITTGSDRSFDAADTGYEPPALRRLGTLAELTQGGTVGPSDGFGGAGASGSI